MSASAPDLGRQQAPWRVFLPSRGDVFALGLSPMELGALARSGARVLVGDADSDTLERARAFLAGGAGSIKAVDHWPEAASVAGIAVGGDVRRAPTLESLVALSSQGGTLVWTGKRRDVPRRRALIGAGFGSLKTFGVIPPGSGKLTLPIDGSRAALSGLSLYRPSLRRNAIAAATGRTLAKVGMQQGLGLRRVLVGNRGQGFGHADSLMEALDGELGGALKGATLYVYTGEHDVSKVGKVTIQLLGEEGRVLGVAKVADAASAHESIRREARALEDLARSPGVSSLVPPLLHSGELQGYEVLVQGPAPVADARSPESLTEAHLEFLAKLTEVDRESRPVEEWPGMAGLAAWCEGGRPEFGEALRDATAELAGERLPLHRVHGDFARSNVLLGREGMCVVDWEESRPQGLPLADLVHFALRKLTRTDPDAFSASEALHAPASWLGIGEALGQLVERAPAYRGLSTPRTAAALLRVCLLDELRGISVSRGGGVA